ncbi:MAG: class I SAM-dependent methyltransferase [Anaerolineae bacterium]|nr:class I SAM-dependent methyltransferase [Anaerolineae bacterium]
MKLSPAPARNKWDRRYAGCTLEDLADPTPFLLSCLPELPPTGLALDVAAGAGRHALILAQQGLQVDAVDISWQGLRLARLRAAQAGLWPGSIDFVVADLELAWLPKRGYDVVVVSFFLFRPLLPVIKDRLRPGGRLVYETRVEPPPDNRSDSHRREFWLKPRELLDAFSDFDVLRYDEGHRRRSGGREGGVTARLLARKPVLVRGNTLPS